MAEANEVSPVFFACFANSMGYAWTGKRMLAPGRHTVHMPRKAAFAVPATSKKLGIAFYCAKGFMRNFVRTCHSTCDDRLP
jgi:hypothetical protein